MALKRQALCSPSPLSTVEADSDIICCTSSQTMTAVRGIDSNGTEPICSFHRAKTLTHEWFPQHCSNPAIRERARDSTVRGQRQTECDYSHVYYFWMYIACIKWKIYFQSPVQRYEFGLLTVREGATAHSLIEYGHKEHVTVFEIWLHFINGLDPGEKTITQYWDTEDILRKHISLHVDCRHTVCNMCVWCDGSSYFQAPNPACHRSEKIRTRLRTFIIASFTKLTWEHTTALNNGGRMKSHERMWEAHPALLPQSE